MIYLDHNATTPLDKRVLDAMLPYLGRFYGNASGLYRLGRISRDAINLAREQVARLAGADPSEVYFTSGGTESNNLAIKGLAAKLPLGTMAFGATEHPSVRESALSLKGRGWVVDELPVDGEGRICRPARLPDSLRFVSVMLANNETGVVADTALLQQIAADSGCLLHCDAVQMLGKLAFDFKRSPIDLLSVSAHKLYGPKGVGALIAKKSVSFEPLLHGGGQENGLRGGTESVAAIVGFGKAAELAQEGLLGDSSRLNDLRVFLEKKLEAFPGVAVFARQAPRLPNTVLFSVARVEGDALVMAMDKQGVALSSGSACSSSSGEPSAVLTAMGVDPEMARTAVRVSLGKENTQAELEQFVDVLQQVITDFRK
ncbi:cysteine desulfurase family protein [Candidatus Methylospira mobilis]|uniref:cysteine desulfurase family protein n=1 Tax=Candidatus Methylospira mobilis TaxID=1808979 RepID=UPI0028E7DB73|nr:cysteine desulfurase family protein [Candidatus Methylospira mobilis]WNV06236.1 cysteine desulfurase family protein [Candidatus Methylospira mobilis]